MRAPKGVLLMNKTTGLKTSSYHRRVSKLARERDARQLAEADRKKQSDKPSWQCLKPGAV